jgi:large subunit ribosomal protein L17
MMRNLSAALIEHEKVTTTLAKAKEVRRFTEKLVTLSKRETLHARRTALRQIPNQRAVAKLFDTLSARYASRPGGYTRIYKLGPRRGDNAEMALIEFVASEAASQTTTEGSDKAAKKKKTKKKVAAPAKKKTTKKTAKKAPAKAAAAKGKPAAKKTAKKKTAAKKKTTKKAKAD